MRYKKSILFGLFLIVFNTISIATTRHRQFVGKPSNPFKLTVLYYPILQIKFPLPSSLPAGTLLLAVLRFQPTDGPESQVTITQKNDGQYNVIEHYLPAGSKSIWSQLSDLYYDSQLSPTQDPAKLAVRFKVETRAIAVPSRNIATLFNQLDQLPFPSMKLKPDSTLVIQDAPQDEFWYKSPSLGEMHFSYVRLANRKDGAQALAEWMDRVRIFVDSQK